MTIKIAGLELDENMTVQELTKKLSIEQGFVVNVKHKSDEPTAQDLLDEC